MDEAEVGRIVGDVSVSYTVRELLSRIEERLVRMETRSESVATTEQVKAVEVKLEHRLEALGQEVDALQSHRDRVLGFAIGLSLAAGGGAGWVANLLAAR